MTTKTKSRTVTVDGAEYSITKTYKDAHGSYWQYASRRDSDDMPIMETDEYYGGPQHDGMTVARLDDLIEENGPIVDADPDLADKSEEVARALRNYRNSMRVAPLHLSPGRASMIIGRLQQSVEHLAEEFGLQADEPHND